MPCNSNGRSESVAQGLCAVRGPVAVTEREQIVAWLRADANGHPPLEAFMARGPVMRVIWAMRHPLKFRSIYWRYLTLCHAADAIERGDYRKDDV